MINITINKSNRMVDISKTVIGNDGENLQDELVFSFSDEFVDGIGRLEYQVQGNKYYVMLEKEDETYKTPIKSVITKNGRIDMQLVITQEGNEGIPIFKSNVFYVYCNKSVNADIEQPEEYSNWIEIANQKMIRMEQILQEAEQMEIEALQLDTDVQELSSNLDNLDIEVDNLTNNMNIINNNVNTNTQDINELEQNHNTLHNELLEQEASLNYLEDKFDNYYTKEEVMTDQEIVALVENSKLLNTDDYCIYEELHNGGENGYRKYKNGKLEQWGISTTQASETEFTLHTAFRNSSYSIFMEVREVGNYFHYAIPISSTKFKTRIAGSNGTYMAVQFQWRAIGRWK